MTRTHIQASRPHLPSRSRPVHRPGPPTSVAKEILEALTGQPSVIAASINSLSKQLTLNHLVFSGFIERLEETIHRERQPTCQYIKRVKVETLQHMETLPIKWILPTDHMVVTNVYVLGCTCFHVPLRVAEYFVILHSGTENKHGVD